MTVNYDIKMVIVARRDLNMRKGKLGSQCGHASLAFIQKNLLAGRRAVVGGSIQEEWLFGGQAKIVVACDDEAHLNELVQRARANAIEVNVITDAGNTEFHGEPTVTCAAFGPVHSRYIDPITGGLKLL